MSETAMNDIPSIDALDVATFRVPTDAPESDGTYEWNHTDLVVVHAHGGGLTGLGWTYAAPAAADLVAGSLRSQVVGRNALDVESAWNAMNRALRNVGVPGAGSMAVAAVDIALWDLKAKLLDVSLCALLGRVRDSVPIYGSGGFTSYTETRLVEQLSGWVSQGISRVKMKIGRDSRADLQRVRAVRAAIGANAELFVDANGGYDRKQALALAERFAHESHVTWFEEPRPSSDLEGLRLLRDRGPAGLEIAAGEYGDTLDYFRRMLAALAVDCLQADATRCAGFTGFMKVAALCEAFAVPLSAHCAPELHAHVGCAAAPLRHVEYFHDHVRIARELFDGVLEPQNGSIYPDPGRKGHGMALKSAIAERYRI